MNNRAVKKLISLILVLGVFLSCVNVVFATERYDDSANVNSVSDFQADKENLNETDNDSFDESYDDELSVAYSTDSENGKYDDNGAPVNVTWLGSVSTSSYEPGSQQNPYAVPDASHFLAMSALINDTANNLKYFRLTSNIDLSSVTISDITSSGADGLANTIVSIDPTIEESLDNLFFNLDGNNKTISGLNIQDNSRNSLAIFGYLNSNCSVYNINFSNISIVSTYTSAVAIGIFLKNEGTISDCTFKNITISASSDNVDDVYVPVTGYSFRVYTGIAGVIVDNEGTFTQSAYFSANQSYGIVVNSTGKRTYVGGVIAQNRGYVYKSKISGAKVEASENSKYVGAFAGANYASAESTSTGLYYVDLTLTANGVKGGDFTGGLVGSNTGRINYSSVSGQNDFRTPVTSSVFDIYMFGGKTYGGIAGENKGIIDKCSSIDIGAYYSDSVPGGVYGAIAGTNVYTIRNSVSTGLVAASDETIDIYAGGIVGVGSNAQRFYVGNCYTLVKLPETSADIGSVVGINGDEPYSNNKVINCFYSSVISLKPSPVSHSGTGASYGDLQYNISYVPVKTRDDSTISLLDFTYSGWGSTSFSVVNSTNSFFRDPNEGNFITTISVSSDNNSVTLTPASTAANKVQTIYYDTDITLPEGIGPVSSGNYVLSSQALALRAMIKGTAWKGNGTAENPYEITSSQISFLSLVPYGVFKFTTTSTTTTNVSITSTLLTKSAVFWGYFDGNGLNLRSARSSSGYPPALFRAVYGSRDNSNPQQNDTTHTSNPESDSSSNLRYGVVKNFSFEYYNEISNPTSILGNICSATIRDITFKEASVTTKPTFNPSGSSMGVAINTVYGNSYIYGVYNDSLNVVVSNNYNTIAGLIGVIDAENAIIDNCGSSCVVTVTANGGINNCSAFIGQIKSLSGTIQNCYSSGGVRWSSSSEGSNYCLFASSSIPSAKIYNCFYSPTDYYENNTGASKAIPEGQYTGDLNLWSFGSQMYIIRVGETSSLLLNPIYNIKRYDIEKYDSEGRSSLSQYFTSSVTGTGYTCTKVYFTSGVTAVIQADSSVSDSAEVYVKNSETKLMAKTSIASSSEIEVDNDGYYLIKKPTDLYMICLNQASRPTDEGLYLSSDYHFKLVANIDMTGYTLSSWGKSSSYPFRGTLEGEVDSSNNPLYTISGLSFSSNSCCGLFGYVDGAKIKNIIISDSSFSGGIYTGALVGQVMSYAEIENCKVLSSSISGSAKVGAIAGGVSNSISSILPTKLINCTASSTTVSAITSQSSGIDNASMCGGIIGCVVGASEIDVETKYAVITGCNVIDSTISANSYDVGGVVGIAPYSSNTISGCSVSGSTVSSDFTQVTTASVGAVAGTFGGSELTSCVVSSSEVNGENASGIVSRIVNFSQATDISSCQVNDTDITGVNYAGGVCAYIGAYSTKYPNSNKTISLCKVDSDSAVSAKVAGGMVGVVMSSYDAKVLSIDECNTYATVTTTGAKGSKTEGAGGIIGRLSSKLDTSGISVTNCVSGGNIVGSAFLGGIIALLNSDAHKSSVPIVSDCYVTATITQKTIKAIKGLIIAYVGENNDGSGTTGLDKVCSNVVFSSYGQSVSICGNVSSVPSSCYNDVNMGSDKTSGITISAQSDTIKENCVVAGDGTNCITLKKNLAEALETTTPNQNSRFNTGNLPSLSGFDVSKVSNVTWASSNTTKLKVGTGAANNRKELVSLLTFAYKGRVNVYTYFSNSNVNGDEVRFTIGFTVICTGTHKFDGQGTVTDPYKIYDAEDVIAIKEHHDSPLDGEDGPSFYAASYIVMNDIDMSDICFESGIYYSFPSIGTSNNPFTGSITSNIGGPFKIRNLYISSQASSYAGNTNEHTEYSNNYGLFGYMNSATFTNINFENANIIGGQYTGLVAGCATDTEISNVNVSGDVSIQECVVGGILVGTSQGSLNINTVTIDGSEISAQTSVGGIVGVASQCSASSITNFTLTDCTIESLAPTGPYYAGGVAGQMNGTVGGVYENDELVSASSVNNCSISGVITSGVVASGSPNYGNNSYGLEICGVNVNATTVTSPVSTSNSVAAGILGKTFESYEYVIEDCTVDSSCTFSANYVASGIVGVVNLSSSVYRSKIKMSNCATYANVFHRVMNVDETYGSTMKEVGVGGIVGLVSKSAILRIAATNESAIRLVGCTVGGTLSGSMNVGGAIGQIASTDLYTYEITEPMIDDCLLLNKIIKRQSENDRFGTVIGAIEGNISSSTSNPYKDRDDYICCPFNNIYYSSYMNSGYTVFGESSFYSYQMIDMAQSVYDLNSLSWTLVDKDNNENELPIAMISTLNNAAIGSVDLETEKYSFSSVLLEQLGTSYSGDIFTSFSIDSKVFELSSITSSDPSVFEIVKVGEKLKINHKKYGTSNIIFTYSNGLQIAIEAICGVQYDGEGTASDPIRVSSEAVFAYVVPLLPNYYFIQTNDLNFQNTSYVIQPIENFGGHYDGGNYSISNITINVSSSDEPVGIFSDISGIVTDENSQAIPNVENLTINNCTITSSSSTSAGIVAGKVTNSAQISNVTINNSSVNASADAGAIAGVVEESSKIKNCAVNSSSVTVSSGCAGGVAGIMNSASSSIESCVVSSTTISSGTANDEDIAGGIVAKAVGTVSGKMQDGALESSVDSCSVTAYISGGAVGSNFASALTSNLTVQNIKISSTNVVASYSGTNNSSSGAGVLARVVGGFDNSNDSGTDNRCTLAVDNCYVDKNSSVSSKKYASGCLGYNGNNNIISITISDTQSYASVNSSQGSNGLTVYAGGIIAYTNGINPNVITMNGCVAGGDISANGYKAYSGGAVGYIDSSNTINTVFFVNGILSAVVSAAPGTNDTSINPQSYYGKFMGGMSSITLFEDNDTFSNTVFHDIYYSSYPQDIVFFGMNEIDKFQSITPGSIPFENINVGSNFTISENLSVDGPWNSIAIAQDLHIAKTFYVKFASDKQTLSYGENNSKTSHVDPEGFSVSGTDSDGNDIFIVESSVSKAQYDAAIGTYYQFSINPQNYGAGEIGASYDCGLATSLPILCVEIEGDGSQSTPYKITNPIQLYVVGYLINKPYYFEQQNDIDLSNTYNQNSSLDEEIINYNGGKGFAPIGTSSTNAFCGNYDGKGYKITGLYINRPTADNVGLFGYVCSTSTEQPATLKNIHVELLESSSEFSKANGIVGKENVAGLVGFVSGQNSNAVIENCSVTRSTVIGSDNVGGLCGKIGPKTTITGSFTESDVYSSASGSCAGGLFGNVSAGASGDTLVNRCFSSSNVYAKSSSSSNTIGNAGGIAGYISNGVSSFENCLFTGSTNGGHGIFGNKSLQNATTASVSSVIDAGRDTSMKNGKFAPVSTASFGNVSGVTVTDSYYDKALVKVSGTVISGLNAKMTSELTTGNAVTGISSDDFDYSSNHYPAPKVDNSDEYSCVYSQLLSVAMLTSEAEEIDDSSNLNYGTGLIYPVHLTSQLSSSEKIIYSSSVFDTTDTVEYPSGYDTNLYGVGSNKNTDLLFEDIEDSQSSYNLTTAVYRNIFSQDMGDESSHSVTNLLGGSCLSNGEVMFNLQMPVVFATVTSNGHTAYREIKIPLSYDIDNNTYCISTQRQLFALGLAEYEISKAGSKFANFYGSNYNYKLITDIVISQDNTTNFTPIGFDTVGGYTGSFDGSNHSITNLSIVQTTDKPTGMFSVAGDGAQISNLKLIDTKVSGVNYVGTLVGKVSNNVRISNCSASGSGSTVTASGSYVGGLIGCVEYAGSTVDSCHSSASVCGSKDSIGGLIGKSSAQVSSCHATGTVTTEKMMETGGIGGLIGYIKEGRITDSFASGNVIVNDFKEITITSTVYGVGGFVGIAEKNSSKTTDGIVGCFSGGNVKFAENATGGIRSALYAVVGVGGFSGVNYTPITNCYSSAAVSASFAEVRNNASSATYGVGIGGVCGVALADVQNVYSSGSVVKPNITYFDDQTGNAYYGVGGTIGTTMNSSASVANCYFDSWVNNNPDMQSVGNLDDDGISRKSFTTNELTSGSNPGGFDNNVWGFTRSAYPYIMSLLNENVSDEVKANAVLSVIVVVPDEEDYSARQGRGLTMALTVPTEFKYTSYNGSGDLIENTYSLVWTGVNGENLVNGKATPTRTQNTAEFLTITVQVVGLEQYASRQYERPCVDMRGTYAQPYLISAPDELRYVCMTRSQQLDAYSNYPNLYGQWATPIDNQGQPFEGKVYYQLMTDIDISSVDRTFTDLGSTVYSYPNNGDYNYSGFVLNGNGYYIQNASAQGAYFPVIDSNSKLTHITFKNINLTGESNTALVGTNDGELYDVYVTGNVTSASGYTAGVAAINNNIIDGCVCDVNISGVSSNTGSFVGRNASGASITRCASAGAISISSTSPSNVAAFVSLNEGKITNSFSMVSISAAGTGTASNVSAFASRNTSGSINACYSRSSIKFASEPSNSSYVSTLCSDVTGGTISNCYTAGFLGYYNNSQHSIAFSTVSGGSISEIYVDKAMTGTPSYNSFKFGYVTKKLISMYNMGSSMSEVFTADSELKLYPKIKAVDESSNTPLVDDNDNIISYQEGTVIRSFDILKAYASVANATIITANSQYIDSMFTDSNNRGINSDVSTDTSWSVSPSGIVNINSSTGKLTTTSTAGTAIASAYTTATFRNVELTPTLNIEISTGGSNSNFRDGYGTQAHPYEINSVESLSSLSYYGTDETLFFRLYSDIDASSYAKFEQIPLFNAHLDSFGNQSSRKNVIANLNLSEGGLFKTISSTAYVGNIGITGAVVNSSDEYTGILASQITGATIENIIVTGQVDAAQNAGMLAGCISSGTNVKGIVTSGYIKGTNVVGGVFGAVDSSKVEDVLSTAYVTGDTSVGGFAGQIVNSSEVDDIIFAGSCTGCAVVDYIDTSSCILTDYYVDYQLSISDTLIGDQIVNKNLMKSSKNLSSVQSGIDEFSAKDDHYIVPSGLRFDFTGQNRGYFAAVEMASMLFEIRSGAGIGTIGKYVTIAFSDRITSSTGSNTNPISGTEVVHDDNNGATGFLKVAHDSNNHKLFINVDNYDESVQMTAIKLSINTSSTGSTVYYSVNGNGRQFRYITPGMVKTVNVSYTLTDTTGELDSKTVGILFRSLSDPTGSKVEVSNVFDKVGTSEENVDALLITPSSNADTFGFYIADMLPYGYEFEITASDGNSNSLTVTTNSSQEGKFVRLIGSQGSDIILNIRIVKYSDTAWGVHDENATIF